MTEENQEQDSSRDYEKEASSMGWTPQENFRGDADKWVDAQTFVERGEKILPLVKAHNKKLTSEVSDLKSTIQKLEKAQGSADEQMSERIGRMQKMYDFALEKQKDQLTAQYKQAKEAAVEEGDLERYRELEEEHKQELATFNEPQFEEEVQTLEKPSPQEPDAQEQSQERQLTAEEKQTLQQWQEKNDWYQKDEKMTNAAAAYSRYLAAAYPDLTLEQNLERTAQQIMSEYNSQDSAPSLIAGGSRTSGAQGGGKGWNDIPQEERKDLERFVQEGLFKDEKEAAAKYWSN